MVGEEEREPGKKSQGTGQRVEEGGSGGAKPWRTLGTRLGR